jgi:hypothetical protein
MDQESLVERGEKLLSQLGPRINELFNGPQVAELIDSALVILVDEDGPDIHVIERMEVMARMPEDSLYDRNPDPRQFPVVVVVAFKDDPSTVYTIPDPRVSLDWHKPGFFD